MPNRMLREGILTSERVDKLSAEAEIFYRRVMSVVDDYARYYALASLLIAACYPLKIGVIRAELIHKWIKDCEDCELLVRYTVAGKEYIQLLDFRQQKRAKHSKFPEPPADVQQMLRTRAADEHLGGGVVVGVVEDEGEVPAHAAHPPLMVLEALDWEWAKKEGVAPYLEQHLAYFNDFVQARGKRYKNLRAAFRNCVRADWGDVRKNASRPRGRNGAAAPKGPAMPGAPWYLTWTGIVNEGVRRGIERVDEETDPAYRDRVFAAAGVTDQQVDKERREWGVH